MDGHSARRPLQRSGGSCDPGREFCVTGRSTTGFAGAVEDIHCVGKLDFTFARRSSIGEPGLPGLRGWSHQSRATMAWARPIAASASLTAISLSTTIIVIAGLAMTSLTCR